MPGPSAFRRLALWLRQSDEQHLFFLLEGLPTAHCQRQYWFPWRLLVETRRMVLPRLRPVHYTIPSRQSLLPEKAQVSRSPSSHNGEPDCINPSPNKQKHQPNDPVRQTCQYEWEYLFGHESQDEPFPEFRWLIPMSFNIVKTAIGMGIFLSLCWQYHLMDISIVSHHEKWLSNNTTLHLLLTRNFCNFCERRTRRSIHIIFPSIYPSSIS